MSAVDTRIFDNLWVDCCYFLENSAFLVLGFIDIRIKLGNLTAFDGFVVSPRNGAIRVEFAASNAAFFLFAQLSLLGNWRTTVLNAAFLDRLYSLGIAYHLNIA